MNPYPSKLSIMSYIRKPLLNNIEFSGKGLRLSSIPQDNPYKVYIETYGCQMNVSDSEVILSILADSGYSPVETPEKSDLILLNTCAIRDNAEQRIRGRLEQLRHIKKKSPGVIIGVLGCMAERLKTQLLEEEQSVDLVVGPDAYRDLPELLKTAGSGQRAINVLLSREETYSDIVPVRMDKNGVSAFVSIMRGCNNMCAYCIVPYTRGGERSRDPRTIIREVMQLSDMGYREVTLLGQNVDSYGWTGEGGSAFRFADLLYEVASVDKNMRVRFATSHPKDMSDEVLRAMASLNNICKSIHLPVQSGSTKILEAMKRGYTREWYMGRIEAIRSILPEASVSTDIISGFSSETDKDHEDTLSLMKEAQFDFAYMFKYSVRPRTYAHRHYEDDVPEEIKSQRLQEIIDLQNNLSAASKQKDVGHTFEVLVEGTSKKSKNDFFGRTSQNKVVVFPGLADVKAGCYVNVKITGCSSATLFGGNR